MFHKNEANILNKMRDFQHVFELLNLKLIGCARCIQQRIFTQIWVSHIILFLFCFPCLFCYFL